MGTQGPPGELGPTDLVFWGYFDGLSMTANETGGPTGLILFDRVSPGVYRLWLDRREGLVAVFASATGFDLSSTANSGVIVSTNIDFDAAGDRLVIEVVTIQIINDPAQGVLIASNVDTVFSLLVLDAP